MLRHITKFFSPDDFVSLIHSITVSHPFLVPPIPFRVIVPSSRHLHTSRPCLFPLSGYTPRKVRIPKKAQKSRTKRVDGKRHWTERIGTAYSRARIRLIEEDPDWRLRLNPNYRRKWKDYIENHTLRGVPIDDGFGLRKQWLEPGNRVVHTRPKEHQELLNLWKQGITKSEERQIGSESENQRPTHQGFLNELRAERELVEEENVSQREPIRRFLDQQPSKPGLIPKERQKSPIAQQPPEAYQIKSTAEQAKVQEFLQRLREQRKMEGLETRRFGPPKNLTSESTEQSASSALMQPLQPLPINEPEKPPVFSFESPPSSPSSQTTAHEVKSPRPITLGLEKITSLLSGLDNPQDQLKVVHVAGTNGKGSVCAYLTSSLVASGLKIGQFTSPHLIDRWDCMTLNNNVIPYTKFLEIERTVTEISVKKDVNASPFEILTACALTYFVEENVDIAVIETGMGGLLDATNVFKSPLVSIITPISLDHTAYLGTTISAIAKHKAGIIKHQCPVVIAPQPNRVHDVIAQKANEVESPLHVALGYWRTPAQTRYLVENVRFTDADYQATPILSVVPGISGSEQSVNVACAVKALSLLRTKYRKITEDAVQKGIASATVPGRMEWVRFEVPEGRVPMLLDGAHNPASCQALGEYVGTLRRDAPVIWVVAFSKGRDLLSCMSKFVQREDSVVCVEFGPVDGMGWVEAVDDRMIADVAKELMARVDRVPLFGRNLGAAIRWAIKETKERKGMLVGTGSLYLVGDIHRLRRDDPQFA